jgi:hypothetical protein
MLDFTEQEVSTTSLPELSADTPIESDNHLGIKPGEVSLIMSGEGKSLLADPETTAATNAKLAPYRPQFEPQYMQDETESIPV